MMTKSEIRALKIVRERMGQAKDGTMSFAGGTQAERDQLNELTRIWRNSWILPVLDTLIRVGEGTASQQDKQYLRTMIR